MSGDSEHTPTPSGRNGPPIKLIALLVVAVALAIFFFQNGSDAPVSFLWFDAEWPVWLVIGVSVVAGVVLDRLGTWQWRRARRRSDRGEG
jgi:uncharacterized integral membrane protein